MNAATRSTVAGLGLLLLAGCAHQKPFVYSNPGQAGASQAQVQTAIQSCESRAKAAGLTYKGPNHIARRTVEGGVVGGATGAATGAIFGSAGKGAAAGATAYATRSFVRSLFDWNRAPSTTYRNYVNHCLRDKGYQPVGWK